VLELTAAFIGGTDLSVENRYVKDDGSADKTGAAALASLAALPGLAAATVPAANGETVEAIALPTSENRAVGAKILRENELGLLGRVYCSFHNEGGAFGASWFLDLPRLIVTNPTGGKLEYTMLAGVKTPIRRFRYTTLFGGNDILFTRYIPDEERNKIVFVPETAGAVRGLYPDEARQRYTVEYGDGGTELFDAAGRLVERRPADGLAITYGYDASGRCVKAELSDGMKTMYAVGLEYDAVGRVVRAQSGQRKYEYAYDERNDLISVRGGADVIAYAYNPLHLVVSVTHHGRPTAAFAYDEFGRLVSETGPDGRAVARHYDAVAGKTETDAAGGKNIYTANGRLEKRIAADGSTVRYEYDNHNAVKLIESIGPNQERSLLEYGNDGRYVRFTDAAGNARALLFDDLGRLRQVQEGKFALLDVKYGMTKQGWTVATDSPDSQRLEVFGPGRRPAATTVVSKISGGGKIQLVYDYDRDGNLRRVTQTGMKTAEAIFENGLPKKIRNGKSEIELTFTAKRLSKVSRAGRDWNFTYGTAGNLELAAGKNGLVETSYAFAGDRLTERRTADGSRDAFQYDAAGRLAGVVRNDEERWELKIEGKKQSIFRNNATLLRYEYDDAGRLVKVSY
jgi:YD repeat-containing protein